MIAAALLLFAPALWIGCGSGEEEVEDAAPVIDVSQPADAPRPHIVWIVVDTLRKDHLSAYGHHRPTSPNLERLAADGVKYERAFAQAPWTTPSVASMLTSRYPTSLQIHNVRSYLHEDAILVSELLQRLGYHTAAAISHDFLNSDWNFDQGFYIFNEDNINHRDAISSPGVTEAAINILEDWPGDPFFLFLHYFDPHNNYHLHEDFNFSEDLNYSGPVHPNMDINDLHDMELSEADLDYLRSLYDSEIAFTDFHIGRVLDKLREMGVYDDALIIFTSDHGEEFLERGFLGHGHELYNEAINIPLIVKFPEGMGPADSAGAVVERNVPLLDLFPTVMDLLNATHNVTLEGQSLLEPGENPDERMIFAENSRLKEVNAIARGDHKFMYYYPTDESRLYDMEADPAEVRDIAAQEKGAVKRLRDAMLDWMDETEAEGEDLGELELDIDQIDRLKHLGYL